MISLLKKCVRFFISEHLINACWHTPRAFLACCIYGFPAKKLICIAIAGTKGKTSTSYLLSQFLDAAHIKNALLCTAAIKLGGEEKLNTLKMTTPDVFFLQQFLRTAIQKGCTHAILEVSSHAISQQRIFGISFSHVAIPTLMPDHLEYHKNATEYQDVHKKLITKNLKSFIVNTDDQNLTPFFSLTKNTRAVSISDEIAQRIQTIRSDIKGSFVLLNIRTAFEAARACGVGDIQLFETVKKLKNAPGRWEYIQEGQDFFVIVDYAHSVDSLTNFLTAVKGSHQGKLIAVFGACGDRDKNQRAPMGSVLDALSDTLIVTTDDSYSEEPQTIADHLLKGVTKKTHENLFTILNRKEAMKKAFSLAKQGDIVCIMGKGAEQWQIFKDKKIPWDDRAIARELLKRMSN